MFYVVAAKPDVELVFNCVPESDMCIIRCYVTDMPLHATIHLSKTSSKNGIVYAPPKIITVKEDYHQYLVESGRDVRLQCSVDGIPEPKVTWKKTGDVDFLSLGPVLHFPSITREDQGEYISLCYSDPLVIWWKVTENGRERLAGKSIFLYRFYSYSEPIRNEENFYPDEGMKLNGLSISDITSTDLGTYVVTAENYLGTAELTFTMQRKKLNIF
ncbi:unnamed protein product [Mytilus coruscus]|uniref:Ig-like domain-containing protein n=1 Tax=Mytilus coruscus TaxID=42192 RepID=A0A6J8F0F1_MYTCO|nr:unnamed protein product [Mytilus coruscus]